MTQQDITVTTPLGSITATIGPDTSNPGLWIRINDQELVLVEYDQYEAKHVIRVWDSEDEDADYIFRHDIVEPEE